MDFVKKQNPEVQRALGVYVAMFAKLAEVDREDLQAFLDGYWLLRRLSEYDDGVPEISAPPGMTAADLAEQVAEAGSKTAASALADMEPVSKPIPSRGTAAAKFKREVRERIEVLRGGGVSLQSMADASRGVTINNIFSILEGEKVDYSLYVALWDGLSKIISTK